MSSSLNDDFSGQTPQGENIFAKAMGNKTVFKTETGGFVSVSFIFDPKQPYGDDHHMASVTSDWMTDMRETLTKHILDAKDIAPKTKTLEETIWDQLTSLLPKETLAKNLFTEKKTFELYCDMIKAATTKTFKEEEALTDALQKKAFSFSFQIAIDAYPSSVNSNGHTKNVVDKTGVLTFHIEGVPDGSLPSAVKEETVASPEANNRKSKKRKATDSDKENDAKKLLSDLALTTYYEKAFVQKDKLFPVTASTFFDAVNRWFSSAVSNKAQKLQKASNRNPLYH